MNELPDQVKQHLSKLLTCLESDELSADGQREAGDAGVCQRAKQEEREAVTMEVFWIGEVCDADRRTKLITKEAREWFATRTISQAIVSYQAKSHRGNGD